MTPARNGSRPSVSGIVITLNEEERIERCLQSLAPFCDELLVVDSHSTDRTRSIAEATGARVIEHPFEYHVQQKNVAVDAASHDWLLSLDADEVLEPLCDDPLAAVDFRDPALVWRLKRRNHYLGAWVEHTCWRRDSSVRLFNRTRARFGGTCVHDAVQGDGCREVPLPGLQIRHWPYRDLRHQIEKAARYADDLSAEMQRLGRPASAFRLVVDPPWRFVRMYIVEGGWRMGKRGFILSTMVAFYVFLKYARLWERSLPTNTTDRQEPTAGANAPT